jgi:hypothetical protein
VSRHNDGGKIRVVVVRTLGFLIVSRLLGLVRLGPSADARDVEVAVLRHQLAGASPLRQCQSDAGPVSSLYRFVPVMA